MLPWAFSPTLNVHCATFWRQLHHPCAFGTFQISDFSMVESSRWAGGPGTWSAWSWALVRPLHAQMERVPPGRSPSAHVSQEHWARQKEICNYKSGKRKDGAGGERGNKGLEVQDVRWWSVLGKRLARKGRRGKQTWVEHAAHIIALTCVYIHTEWHGSILLLLVPASACIYGRHSANITSPSGDTRSEHYAGWATRNGLKDQAHFWNSPCRDRSSVFTKLTLSTKMSICGQTVGQQGHQQPFLFNGRHIWY